MIFEEIEKRTGKKFIVDSKYWPGGTRFRRRFSNKTLAKSVLGRIEGAIAMGTWKELRKELAGEEEQPDYTIREFAVGLRGYCTAYADGRSLKERQNPTRSAFGLCAGTARQVTADREMFLRVCLAGHEAACSRSSSFVLRGPEEGRTKLGGFS